MLDGAELYIALDSARDFLSDVTLKALNEAGRAAISASHMSDLPKWCIASAEYLGQVRGY